MNFKILGAISLAFVCAAGSRSAAEEPSAEAGDPQPYLLSRNEGEVLVDSRGRTTIVKVSPGTGSVALAMGTQDMPPGSGIIVHKHDRTEEILYVTEGSGSVVVGDETFHVGKDTTIWIPPGTWHGVQNPRDHMHILWFVTPPGLEGFFRGMFWTPGSEEKHLTTEEIREIERQHDSIAKR